MVDGLVRSAVERECKSEIAVRGRVAHVQALAQRKRHFRLVGEGVLRDRPCDQPGARVPDGAAACKFFTDAGRERPENYEKDVQLPPE